MNIGELLKKLIEHNKRIPPIDLLQKFSELFGIKLSTLILMSEEYSELQEMNKAEIFIQKKMIQLVNKYSTDLEEPIDV